MQVLRIHTYIWEGVIRFAATATQGFGMMKGFQPVPGPVLITENVAMMERLG